MHILVTGGAGFIGSHVVDWLVSQGHTVRVFDNLSTGREDNLRAHRTVIDMRVSDIRDRAAVQASVMGVDRIIHLAALVSVAEAMAQPELAHEINVTGTLHLLEAARAAGVQRVVLASSCAIYGDPKWIPTGEDTPANPISPYAVTKHIGEQYARLYNDLYGLECVVLRLFNVYGPRQDLTSPYAAVVPRFLAAVQASQRPTIFGDGQQSRDFIYVSDIVRALWIAATVHGIAGRSFNVGSGKACSILELVDRITSLLGIFVPPQFAPAREGEIRHSCADVTRFASQTGFYTSVDLPTGLATMLTSMESRQK
jgi:nucleoside-diphosphate-sugar epimerase